MPSILGIRNLELPGLRPVTSVLQCLGSFLGELKHPVQVSKPNIKPELQPPVTFHTGCII